MIHSKPIKGHLYCMHNIVYVHNGVTYYKLGNSKNVIKRLNGYTTSYLEPSVIMFISEKLRNKFLGEKILFEKLKDYRIVQNREFFKCDIELIKKEIELISSLFSKHSDEELENLYFPDTINNFISPKKKKEKQYLVSLKIDEKNYVSEYKKIIPSSAIFDKNSYVKHEMQILFNNKIPESLLCKVYFCLCTTTRKKQWIYNACYFMDSKHTIFDNKKIVVNIQQYNIVKQIILFLKLSHCQDTNNKIFKTIVDTTIQEYIVQNYDAICLAFSFLKNDVLTNTDLHAKNSNGKFESAIFYCLRNILYNYSGCDLKVDDKSTKSNKSLTYKLSGINFCEYI